MSSPAPVAETLPRRSRSRFVLGLSVPAVVCILAGAFVAVFSIPVIGGLRGLLVTSPVWLTLLVLGLVPVPYIDGKAVDWLPVGASYVIRRATRQNRYRRPVWRTRPAGTLALPGSRARLRMELDEVSGAVMVHDPVTKTLTAVAMVGHGQFMLADAGEQASRGDGFSTLLSTLGESAGVSRIQVLLRSTADAGVGVRRYWREHRDAASGEELVRASYEELLAQSAQYTERHESTITVVLDLDRVRSTVKAYGGGLKGGAAVLRQRMATLESLLPGAGLSLRGWMTDRDLAAVIRGAYDPAAAVRFQFHPEEIDDLSEAGPMAVDGGWTSVHTDGGWHKVMRIARWPRMKARLGFMSDLVLLPGVRVAVSIVYRPVDANKAEKEARHENAREVGAFEDRRRAGRLSTVVHQRDNAQTVQHMAELDAGFTDMDHAVMVTVSAPSKRALDRSVEDVRTAIRGMKCTPRTLVAQQDELFEASTMPLGLGVR